MDKNKYMDEKIIKMKKLEKEDNLKNQDISESMIIDDEEYKMNEVILVYDFISIMLPEYFIDMPQELSRLKYPSEFRPPIIKTSYDTKVNITFNVLEYEVNNEYIDLLDTIEKIKYIKGLNMGFVEYLDKKIIENEYFKICGFDYISTLIDGKLYNFEFIFPLGNALMYLTFSCPIDKYKIWKELIQKIVKTIKVVD